MDLCLSPIVRHYVARTCQRSKLHFSVQFLARVQFLSWVVNRWEISALAIVAFRKIENRSS